MCKISIFAEVSLKWIKNQYNGVYFRKCSSIITKQEHYLPGIKKQFERNDMRNRRDDDNRPVEYGYNKEVII